MNKTLKRLRIKFIAIIMAVVSVILGVVFTAIVALNYTEDTAKVHDALDEAIIRDTATQKAWLDKRTSLGSEKLEGDASDHGMVDEDPLASEKTEADKTPRFEIGGREPGRSMIPVAVYEVDTDGTLTLLSSAASGFLSASTLTEATKQMGSLSNGYGFLDSIGAFYLKEERAGTTYVAFADEGSVTGWKSLALNLLAIGLGTLVLFFLVSLLFSKWALRPVEASWKQQQRFIADASHELKTPLTVMAADVAILKRHPERSVANQSQWIESIESEIAEMHGLVGDMLLLASADAQEGDTIAMNTGSVELSKLLDADILQFEPLAYEHEIQLSAHISRSVVVLGDEDKLQRLVSVLFDNAFKYVDKNGTITVDLAILEESAKLSVSNTGAPIPAEDLPHIFDRFYRSDASRARNESKSFGLGLSIAAEIAEAHGGSIAVASAEETGTTFTVTLPLAR